MRGERLYLKQNVLAEPLINQWYAWTSLLYPPTAAMYTGNVHVKIMESFVQAPHFHVSALKNPAMMGGPFINYDAGAVEAIRALMEKTNREQADMLKLAEAIKGLNETLASQTLGLSLEPTYKKVPDLLKGFVELVYDLDNHPSVRFIEGMFYKSRFYKQDSQSVALSFIESDNRPFVFSTPRLENSSTLFLRVPFKSEALDELFKMKSAPQPFGHIKEALSVNGESEKLFSTLFTDKEPHKPEAYTGDSVRILYFGHACLLIETRGVRILTDPVISHAHGNGIPRLSFADLPDSIDYVLITHNHQDHCMLETLLQLRHKIGTVVVPKNNGGTLADPSLKLALKTIGFEKVVELDELETLEVEGGDILGVPFLGEHADLNIRSKIAYLIRLHDESILCAADSNNIEPMMYRLIHEMVGDVDVIFLGMECDGAPLSWIYGALLSKPISRKSDQSRRLNGSDFERAYDMVTQLIPRQVYVYAMGQEPWLTHVTSIRYTDESRPIIESKKLIEACNSQGIIAEMLFGQKEILLGCD